MRKSLFLICLAGLCGCTSISRQNPPATISLPVWFTSPGQEILDCTPVNLNMRLPDHLRPLAKKYDLPAWVVYGVVRCLGSQECTVNGTYRFFTSMENNTESEVVVDDLHYDVTIDGIDRALAHVAEECSSASNNFERLAVLARHVKYRSGAYVLFSLAPDNDDAAQNLLAGSGEDDSPAEMFFSGANTNLPVIGWTETATHFINTIMGEFRYGNAVGSFQRTEEEAIHDMARNIVLKYSHMRKNISENENTIVKDRSEETYKEEILVRISGLNVIRRAVDPDTGTSLVSISVPKSGIRPITR